MTDMRHLGLIVATMTIIGCGSPSPDSSVMDQVGRSAEALRSTSTSDRARTSPGVNPSVQQDVQGQEFLDITAPLQAQALGIKEPSDKMAPMTYALADLESESEQAHELWLEQAIREVTEFDTL